MATPAPPFGRSHYNLLACRGGRPCRPNTRGRPGAPCAALGSGARRARPTAVLPGASAPGCAVHTGSEAEQQHPFGACCGFTHFFLSFFSLPACPVSDRFASSVDRPARRRKARHGDEARSDPHRASTHAGTKGRVSREQLALGTVVGVWVLAHHVARQPHWRRRSWGRGGKGGRLFLYLFGDFHSSTVGLPFGLVSYTIFHFCDSSTRGTLASTGTQVLKYLLPTYYTRLFEYSSTMTDIRRTSIARGGPRSQFGDDDSESVTARPPGARCAS